MRLKVSRFIAHSLNLWLIDIWSGILKLAVCIGLSALQLQNAQQAVLEKNDLASATKDELESTRLRMESLSSQLQQYQKDVSAIFKAEEDLLTNKISCISWWYD